MLAVQQFSRSGFTWLEKGGYPLSPISSFRGVSECPSLFAEEEAGEAQPSVSIRHVTLLGCTTRLTRRYDLARTRRFGPMA